MSIRSDEKSVVLQKIEILWRELIMKFSDRLKGLREKNDMTQEQLAKVSGVSPPYHTEIRMRNLSSSLGCSGEAGKGT